MAMCSPQSPREPIGRRGGDVLSSPSASDQEDEYVVDRIIAQSVPDDSDDEEEMYLVRWEGYPDEQCTWEPRESFLSELTLELWARARAQKQILSQDEVNEIIRKMDAYAEAEEERRRRREKLTKNGKSKSAAASKTNQSLMHSSRQEPNGLRDPPGSRLPRPHNTARAELLLPSTTKSRPKNFQGIGVEPRVRKSSHRTPQATPKGVPGVHFKTLSSQYRYQKAGRTEPVPEIGKIKLKSVTDIVAAAGEDTAHILPSGESRPAPLYNTDLRNTQALVYNDDKLESVQTVPTSAIQTQLLPAALQHESGSGDLPPISAVVNTQRHDVHYLPSGRYWLQGEILLYLTVQREVVGDVRVGGLPHWFRLKMIALKVGHQVLIDFQFIETMQYDALCRGRSNHLLANAYMIPFEDSEAVLTELADSLDHNKRAALWYHPDIPYVLIAYAAASNEWRFLDGGNAFPPEHKIHLALRNRMPKIEMLAAIQAPEGQAASLKSRETTTQFQIRSTSPDSPTQVVNMPASGEVASYIAEQDLGAKSKCSTTSKADDVSEGETFASKYSTNLWLAGSSAESDSEYSRSSTESVERPASPFMFTVPSAETIDAAFQSRFGISYDHLTRPSVMPTSCKDALDPTRARFYLAFPLSSHAEMEALRALLSHHTLPNLICTSAEPQGWDGFKTILGDKMDHRGVIIFHAKYTNYSGLPGLATLLKMVNVNLFNLSLQQVLPYCDLPIYIERLFPNGTAILLTESSMAQQPDRVLAILCWFSQMAKTKRGTWKVVLVPNVKHWLIQTIMYAGALQACFLDMLTEISELSLGQPITYRSLADEESEAESLDGCDDEVGKPSLVVSAANIPAYDRCREKGNSSTDLERDRVLVDWFAGWAAVNAQRHRKFTAISGVAPLFNQESDRWGHIEVVDPDKYMVQNKIPLKRPSPKDPPNHSPG